MTGGGETVDLAAVSEGFGLIQTFFCMWESVGKTDTVFLETVFIMLPSESFCNSTKVEITFYQLELQRF